ncbi:MAG: folK [Burkholderiaceae bacterium]|nr:folK [Burkholderiaceae bacterium]
MKASAVIAYIGLGANLGDAAGNVTRALARLGKLPQTELRAQSSLFCTAPVDADGDDYVNAVAQITTQLAPLELLRELQTVENDFGRERPYVNAPRTLDLDILLYGDRIIASDELVVPHPRLAERAFALIPLLQLDPLIAIPGKGPAHVFVPAVAGQGIRQIGK